MQSDQVPHCLPFYLLLLGAFLGCKANLFNFITLITAILWLSKSKDIPGDKLSKYGDLPIISLLNLLLVLEPDAFFQFQSVLALFGNNLIQACLEINPDKKAT